jgi:hypothetical protein
MPPPIRDAIPVSLMEPLQRIGDARNRDERNLAFDRLAAELSTTVDPVTAEAFVSRYLDRKDPNAQRFALELLTRLTRPPSEAMLAKVLLHLARSRGSATLKLKAAALFLKSLPEESPRGVEILDALCRKSTPWTAANRMRHLRNLVPGHPAVDGRIRSLEDQSKSPCPRCGVRLPHAEFVKHVWHEHRLYFEGGEVQEPWHVIERWVMEHLRTGRDEVLDRAGELAQSLDPEAGLTRVHQLLLAAGSADPDSHSVLKNEARDRHASLCPHCFGLAALAPPVEPAPVSLIGGRIEWEQYIVDVVERPLFTRLVVHGPHGYIYVGPEPARSMTRRGAVWVILTPVVLLACALAVLPPPLPLPRAFHVGVTLVIGMIFYIAIRMYWDEQDPPPDRAIDHAWETMVPPLRQATPDQVDVRFLSGLAKISVGYGSPDARRGTVMKLINDSRTVPFWLPYAAWFHLLALADRRQLQQDDLPQLAEWIGDGLTRTLPLTVVEQILAGSPIDPKDRARRARLRILVLTQAFEAGFEADDLRELGRAVPVLGSTYASEDLNGLARLRLLWLYRARRLWQKVGSATAVFEIARFPTLAGVYLKARPDLLLFQASAGNAGEAAPILICEEGVVYRESVITHPRTRIDILPRATLLGGGYDLRIGDARYPFRDDPTLLVKRLKAWATFLFNEFLPQARLIRERQTAQLDTLLLPKLVACPECQRPFVGIAGDLGRSSVRTRRGSGTAGNGDAE